jgi:hypothetical protein
MCELIKKHFNFFFGSGDVLQLETYIGRSDFVFIEDIGVIFIMVKDIAAILTKIWL